MYVYCVEFLTGKTTATRRTAVREAGVSRQSCAPNWGETPWKPPRTPITALLLCFDWFKGVYLIAPVLRTSDVIIFSLEKTVNQLTHFWQFVEVIQKFVIFMLNFDNFSKEIWQFTGIVGTSFERGVFWEEISFHFGSSFKDEGFAK